MLYLDEAATSPMRPEVAEAMWPYLAPGGEFGNPSSRHELGERAARALAEARERIAAQLECRPGEVVLTSGGSESDNLAIKGIALAEPRGRHLVTTAIEHEAVLASADYLRRVHGFELDLVPLSPEGLVRPEALARVLRDDTTLVSIHHGNNEIGCRQPIAELAEVAHRVGIRVHTDAVQSAPWGGVGLAALGVDAISLAGHKLGAPKGTGVLVVRSGLALEPLVHGGGQERGRRSGTENVAGAVALAAALELRPSAEAIARVTAAREALIDGVLERVPGAQLTGPRRERLPGHASFCFPGTAGEAVLLELERRGVLCSSGSACSAGRDEPSPVLLALGLDAEVAQTAVRLSFGAGVDRALAERVVDELVEAVAAVARLGR